ncbi:hypothetical protein K5X82_01490 [Halosquirtibacter xylanolyticus]|uniref:hypothetical protein n=1 Tax=Halosquirtibacter xylanolyticus TaxID=3374599 RepID=UPI00374A1D8E|nr:hypothetical protein K5X82_01490 [Prolixibacteraceae bacterium]
MFLREISKQDSEPKKIDTPPVSNKKIRKTVRITNTPDSSILKEEKESEYSQSKTPTQHTPTSIAYIWSEIMTKIKEPTELVFFQQHVPKLASTRDLQLEVLPKDIDIAKNLCDRIERYFTARTKIQTKVSIIEKEGSKEEQEKQSTLNEMIHENEALHQLVQNFQLHFE